MHKNKIMFNIVKNLLLEAKIKDVFPTISNDYKIVIVLKNGKTHAYDVQSNVSGKIIMNDIANNIPYVLGRNSIEGDELKIFKYDGNNPKNDFKGKELILKIKDLSLLNKKTGKTQNIDSGYTEDEVKSKEKLERVSEFNDVFSSIKKDDILIITTESEPTDNEGDDTIVNDLSFKLTHESSEWRIFELIGVNNDKEFILADIMKKVILEIKNKLIFMSKKNTFEVDESEIILKINVSDGSKKGNDEVKIHGIIDVSIENEGDEEPEEEEISDEELEDNKEDLIDYIRDTPEYKNLINKTPGFWGTLAGASPKGLAQLTKMLQKSTVKNSYFTKGNKIKFKLISDNILIDDKHKLIRSKNSYYEGVIINNKNVIKFGHVARGHWEIKILDEMEDSNYKAKIIFCNSKRVCKLMSKNSIIKILSNG